MQSEQMGSPPKLARRGTGGQAEEMSDGRQEAGKWASAVEPLRRIQVQRLLFVAPLILTTARMIRHDGVYAGIATAAGVAVAIVVVSIALKYWRGYWRRHRSRR